MGRTGLGSYLRSMPAGLAMIALSIAIMALGAVIAQSLSNMLVIDFAGSHNQTQQSGWVLVGSVSASASGIGNISDAADGEQYKIVNGDDYVIFKYTNNKSSIEIVNTSLTNVTLASAGWHTDNIVRIDSGDNINIGTSGNALTIKANGAYWKRSGTVELYKYIPPSSNNNAIPALDLGFIPGMSVVFAGLYLFLRGLRQVTRTSL